MREFQYITPTKKRPERLRKQSPGLTTQSFTETAMADLKVGDSAEVWKHVAGYEGIYEVSSLGRVRSSTRRVRNNAGTRWAYGRILSPAKSAGYPTITLRKPGVRVPERVHRLVAKAFIGPCPDGCEVNHKNLNRCDNRVENLEYVSHAENMRHACANGAVGGRRGEAHYRAKITRDDVREIRSRRANGETYTSIGNVYGLAHNTIILICRREIWKHV